MNRMQSSGMAPPEAAERPAYTLWQLVLYFLRLGTTGFGGPVALAVKRFTAAVMAEVEGEFLASVREYRTSDGRYRIPGEFVTVAGGR